MTIYEGQIVKKTERRRLNILKARVDYLAKKIDNLDLSEGSRSYLMQEFYAMKWVIKVTEMVIWEANREILEEYQTQNEHRFSVPK